MVHPLLTNSNLAHSTLSVYVACMKAPCCSNSRYKERASQRASKSVGESPFWPSQAFSLPPNRTTRCWALWLSICIYVRAFDCMYIECVCKCVYIHMEFLRWWLYVYMRECVFMYLYMSECVCVRIHVWMCLYVRTRAWMYLSTFW